MYANCLNVQFEMLICLLRCVLLAFIRQILTHFRSDYAACRGPYAPSRRMLRAPSDPALRAFGEYSAPPAPVGYSVLIRSFLGLCTMLSDIKSLSTPQSFERCKETPHSRCTPDAPNLCQHRQSLRYRTCANRQQQRPRCSLFNKSEATQIRLATGSFGSY